MGFGAPSDKPPPWQRGTWHVAVLILAVLGALSGITLLVEFARDHIVPRVVVAGEWVDGYSMAVLLVTAVAGLGAALVRFARLRRMTLDAGKWLINAVGQVASNGLQIHVDRDRLAWLVGRLVRKVARLAQLHRVEKGLNGVRPGFFKAAGTRLLLGAVLTVTALLLLPGVEGMWRGIEDVRAPHSRPSIEGAGPILSSPRSTRKTSAKTGTQKVGNPRAPTGSGGTGSSAGQPAFDASPSPNTTRRTGRRSASAPVYRAPTHQGCGCAPVDDGADAGATQTDTSTSTHSHTESSSSASPGSSASSESSASGSSSSTVVVGGG
jgi:hypothetical protein